MPTYDYICGACNEKMEIFHSITLSAKRKCPKCGALKLRKSLSPGGGVIFKGSGFYATDYRKNENIAPEPGEGGN